MKHSPNLDKRCGTTHCPLREGCAKDLERDPKQSMLAGCEMWLPPQREPRKHTKHV